MTVSDDVAERLAGAAVPAHLATSVEDRPHVAPVWYGYDEGHLQTLTGGRKLANVRENPRVAASIEYDEDEHWRVTIQGTATVVEDPDRVRAAARRIFEKYTGEPENNAYTDSGGDPEGTLIDVRIGSATLATY